MRLLSFIGIILVLGLNLVPCGDVIASLNGNRTEQAIATHHSEKSNDACTPFCNCACCATASVTQEAQVIATPFAGHVILFSAYPAGKFIAVDLPIWQPPQLIS